MLRVRLDVPDDKGRDTVTVSRTVTRATRRCGVEFSKATFPLALGYAMTAHRCQGATLTGRVVVHVRDAFAPGIVYVMLSRVQTREQLCILGELQPRDFVPATADTFPPDPGDATHAQHLPDDGDGDDDDAGDAGARRSAAAGPAAKRQRVGRR